MHRFQREGLKDAADQQVRSIGWCGSPFSNRGGVRHIIEGSACTHSPDTGRTSAHVLNRLAGNETSRSFPFGERPRRCFIELTLKTKLERLFSEATMQSML